MRYTSYMPGINDAGFNAGVRPPLDLIDKGLVVLLKTRDRILEQQSAAEAKVRELADPDLDIKAAAADAQSASAAARAGEPIPAPAAAAKLTQGRETADRELGGQRAALIEITNDCRSLASKLHDDGQAKLAASQEKARAELEALANKLADAVEAVALRNSMSTWLRSGVYQRDVTTWPADAMPSLANRGISRASASPIAVRTILLDAATSAVVDYVRP